MSDLDCSFHLFEPSVDHYAELQKLFAGMSGIALNRKGLSNKTETLMLHKDQAISGLASLLDRDLDYMNIDLSMTESVDVITGDLYCAERGINRIDYLKIDVEGWEMSVLEGFAEMFASNKIGACQFEFTSAQIERRENFRGFYRWFRQHDYTINIIKPNGILNTFNRYEEILESYFATNYLAISPIYNMTRNKG